MTKAVNISVSDGDLADIDMYCSMHNITRSKFFVQSALEKVQVEHIANSLILISGYLDRIESGEVISEDDKRDLLDIVRVISRNRGEAIV